MTLRDRRKSNYQPQTHFARKHFSTWETLRDDPKTYAERIRGIPSNVQNKVIHTERNPRMHARKHPPVWETEINVVDEERNDSKHKFQLQLQHTQVQKTNLNDMVAICTLYSRVHVNYFPSFGTFFTPFRSPQRKPATPGVTRKWKCLNKKLHFKYRKMSTIVSRGARQSRPNMIFESIKCLLHCRHILSYIKQLSP